VFFSPSSSDFQDCVACPSPLILSLLKLANQTVQSQLSKLQSQIIKLPENNLGPTDIVLTSPPNTPDMTRELGANKTALVIIPHGGPHSTSLNEFSPSTAAM
jgi:acylaminoacyl-peptidase